MDVRQSGLIRWWIYIAPFPAHEARRAIIREVVADCLDRDARRLVVEFGDEGRNHLDRSVIAHALSDRKGYLHYSHEMPWSHPGLELADLGAWMYGAGGRWRKLAAPTIAHIRRVNC